MFSQPPKPKRLVLLDAHAILHRAYHALPDFSSSKGEPTGGLYGLSAMLIKILNDLRPDYIVACYDMPGPTFRHEAYEGYKAKRPKTEDDLVSQMNRSRDVFKAFSIPYYEKEGFEADDILGTIVHQMKNELSRDELEIIIASGDMDTLQLVGGKRVQVYTLKKGINDTILYDEKAVFERFGFPPKLLPDYKGLRGDPSDNIIGIKGIGEKTATTLIQKFGDIETIYKNLKANPASFERAGLSPRAVKLLAEGEEEALFSKTLALIRADAPVAFSLPAEAWKDAVDSKKIAVLFRELGFRTLLDRVQKLFSPEVKTEQKKLLEEKEEEAEDPEEIKKIAIALWLVNSDITNPSREDILRFAETESLAKAKEIILKELKKRDLEKVYYGIELPLVPILLKAQNRGVLIDTKEFHALSQKYKQSADELQKEIFKKAGTEFNINSPRQLGEVLFDKLGLSAKGLKKTEGGARSTRESELAKLKGESPIIDLILEYREFQKLISTYTDALPALLDRENTLHTTFIQSGTTTGRFSSVNPNLQNIPSHGSQGKEIRKAFIARPGHLLASFDYSQIELRVLALLSKDKDLIGIFKKGKDIHAAVAAHIFGVPEQEATSEMRKRAKVINFGIIYGMGVTSLERALGTTRAEAQHFYDNYFNEFPGVASYIQEIKKEAARLGYTKTLFGRIRSFEGIQSHIPYIRAAAERMAVNAPVQGTATGDIIKLAIVRVDEALAKEKMGESAFLLLQVHDELVYEIKKEIIGRVLPLIQQAMEHVIEGEVPLVVNVSVGENWGIMKEA